MIPINDLKPGMTTGRDVLNNRNQILIPRGTIIALPHLRALKIWGIESVLVLDKTGEPHPSKENTGTRSQHKKEIMDNIKQLFCRVYTKPPHPVIKIIIPICADKLALQPDRALSGKIFDKKSGPQTFENNGVPNLKLSDVIRKTKDLFSLPDIHNQLTEAIHNPYSSAADIARVVGRDPGLTARLLRIVNSAFYGFPSKIESVAQGVTILGTKELCDLALATSVIQVFDDALKGVVDMMRFWHHSIGCGILAKKLALSRNETSVERFFVMGILHDVGRLILFSQASTEMSMVLQTASDTKEPTYRVEKKMLGFSHADLGHALLKEWRLPVTYQEAILYHHTPTRARRFRLETAIVHVADMLSSAMCMGNSGSTVISGFDHAAWDLLEIDPTFLPQIIQTSEQEINDLISIFKD